MAERKPREYKPKKKVRPRAVQEDEGSSGRLPPEAIPTVSALMRKAEKVRKAQMNLTLKKVRGLSEKDQESLEAMTKALVQEILREPIERIGEGAEEAESYVEVVRKLFRLDTEEPE
ncbi:MAG: hypothetical protein JSV02_05465 [Dehalococcoidia bacterium]|nr:MAG: hypothetical protein JSV02_05465 [Dehalococcoidia bacterium]